MALDATAVIRVESLTPEVHSRLINASERGVLLVLPSPRPVGTRIRITVQIGDPVYEIAVTGVIVHVTSVDGVDPSARYHAGIALTETNDDWVALCKRLAKLAPR